MTNKKTPKQVYKALLEPSCTATLVERSRKKMINGVMPTKALVKKAEKCARERMERMSPKPSPRVPVASPPKPKKTAAQAIPTLPPIATRAAPAKPKIASPIASMTRTEKSSPIMLMEMIDKTLSKRVKKNLT